MGFQRNPRSGEKTICFKMIESILRVGVIQMRPSWLDRKGTELRICEWIEKAGKEKCGLAVFGEAILPGYPFWVGLTGGAMFNSDIQKDLYAHYCREAVVIDRGDLNEICNSAAKHNIAIYLGIIERASDRGGHSLYCTLVHISAEGKILSTHRKLMPTYEERLVWAQGDGNGLVVHKTGPFTAGGLNCWENWIPMARMALYGMGENLHIAVWPGQERNTEDITRFIAKESRSYVISSSGMLFREDIGSHIPHHSLIASASPDILANGGSCIAGPDGTWVVEPVVDVEKLIVADLDFNNVLRERQNFDPAGHYSRPDVLRLTVNKERQTAVSLSPDKSE